MSKKGVSAEEKRLRMQSIFYENPEVFTLKEIETLAAKKGIIMNAVKDVLKSLVDDNLVETDKIGAGNYFWALPSKAGQIRAKRLKEVEDGLVEVKTALSDGKKRKQAAVESRKPSDERTAKLARLAELRTEKSRLQTELAKVSDNDPEFLDKLKSEADRAKEAVNRWTDNIQNVQQYVKDNFAGIEMSQFNSQFGIPEDLDYVQ